MIESNYNPDVLACLANLSNDEVFTPPKLVNEMLDMLPADLFCNPNIKFLDPACKTGVFLREIAKRLDKGLEKHIPDKQQRINHIFTKQLYGIAITELTALLSRRTVYGSKTANGKYSFCESFDNAQGNIYYERIQHTWENGRCVWCGASQEVYDRGVEVESYAYNFIHTDNPLIFFNEVNMKFDVIIGNPPYQLSDGGAGASAIPLYHKFVEQAKRLKPKYLCMIIPARWFAGGRGLDDFRDSMLNDKRIKYLVDYPISSECFPGVEIKGGICYFLWDREYNGKCQVKTIMKDKESILERNLLEKGNTTFLRYNESISIFEKVKKQDEPSFDILVSSMKPFGLRTYFKGKKQKFEGSIKVYSNKEIGYIKKDEIISNIGWVEDYKVYITRSYGAGEEFPHQVLNKPILGEPNSCCTETYLVIGPFSNKKRAENAISYIKTHRCPK